MQMKANREHSPRRNGAMNEIHAGSTCQARVPHRLWALAFSGVATFLRVSCNCTRPALEDDCDCLDLLSCLACGRSGPVSMRWDCGLTSAMLLLLLELLLEELRFAFAFWIGAKLIGTAGPCPLRGWLSELDREVFSCCVVAMGV